MSILIPVVVDIDLNITILPRENPLEVKFTKSVEPVNVTDLPTRVLNEAIYIKQEELIAQKK